METRGDMLNRYRGRVIFPAMGALKRAVTKHAIRVEDYILPVKSRKKERVSERIRDILYKK